MKNLNDVASDFTNKLTRRHFGAATLAGAFAAGSKSLFGAKNDQAADWATKQVEIGHTGVKTSRLAQGTGLNGGARSSAHGRLGEKAFTRLVRHSLDRGVALMDTADLYGTHRYLRTALNGVPRDQYAFLTKIWPRTEFWNMASGGATKEVERFRKELDSDVLEIVLIHCMLDKGWTDEYQRIRDELSELKQQGKVKAIGVSCHDFGALKVACAHEWTDVVLARINHVGQEAYMDAPVDEVSPILKQARANGKTVIGMKIFGAGRLVKPEQRDESLRFVFENDLVDAMTIGMMNTTEVDDTLERISKAAKA